MLTAQQRMSSKKSPPASVVEEQGDSVVVGMVEEHKSPPASKEQKSPSASMVDEQEASAAAHPEPDPPNRNPNLDVPTVDAGRRKGPAPRGECKFDGTDYPDWLHINPFKKADEPFTFPFPEAKGDPWVNAGQMVKDFDNNMCTAWVDEIQNILIFAGLFSAIVTAFAVQTQNLLQPDPAVASVLLLAHLSGQLGNSSSPITAIAARFQNDNSGPQSIRINVLIYFSLVLSLGTALVGIIALQWIRSYRHSDPQTHQDRIQLRHTRYESLMTWKVPQIISALPLFLQASLVIFFAGLIDLLQSLNTTVMIIITFLIGTILLFVVFTMIAPGMSIVKFTIWIRSYELRTFQTFSPYQSPQAWLFVQLVLFFQQIFHSMFSDIGFPATWDASDIYKMAQAHNWPQLAKARGRYIHFDFIRHLSSEATTLGWMLKNFTQDVESFCSLFHCFQTLDTLSMNNTIVEVSDHHIKDELLKVQHSVRDGKIGTLEAKQVFSVFLLQWARTLSYWDHSEIRFHSTELLLRSATYMLFLESPDTRLVPSQLYQWRSTFKIDGLYREDAFQNGMSTFVCLIALQGSHMNPTLFVHDSESDYDERNLSFLFHHMKFCIRHCSTHIVDDFLMVMRNWLETWLTTDPDEDVSLRGAWKTQLLRDFFDRVQRNYRGKSGIGHILMQRPNMHIMLDRMANHPKGQRFWEASKLSCRFYSSGDWWDMMLVVAFLEQRCATLVYDQETVERLVQQRDTPALIYGTNPNTSGQRQELSLEVEQYTASHVADLASHNPHAARNFDVHYNPMDYI